MSSRKRNPKQHKRKTQRQQPPAPAKPEASSAGYTPRPHWLATWANSPPPAPGAVGGPVVPDRKLHPTQIAYRRLSHARAYCETLQREVGMYMERVPFRLVPKHDRKKGRHIACVEIVEHPPASWGLIAGDIIHNLRASLDNLFWGFALRHQDPVANGRASFPIFKDRLPKSLTASPQKRSRPSWKVEGRNLIQAVSPEVGRAIEAVQPFNLSKDDPSRDPLWIVDRLWNEDKHKRITVVTANAASQSVVIGSLHASHMSGPYFRDGPFEHGDELASIEYDPAGYFHGNFQFQTGFYIAFSQEGPGRGLPFPDLLLDLLDYLHDSVIPRFHAL